MRQVITSPDDAPTHQTSPCDSSRRSAVRYGKSSRRCARSCVDRHNLKTSLQCETLRRYITEPHQTSRSQTKHYFAPRKIITRRNSARRCGAQPVGTMPNTSLSLYIAIRDPTGRGITEHLLKSLHHQTPLGIAEHRVASSHHIAARRASPHRSTGRNDPGDYRTPPHKKSSHYAALLLRTYVARRRSTERQIITVRHPTSLDQTLPN